jgi:hypothetical protein
MLCRCAAADFGVPAGVAGGCPQHALVLLLQVSEALHGSAGHDINLASAVTTPLHTHSKFSSTFAY